MVRSLARYDLVALPVVDDNDCLVGVITVDDVLDHILPNDWRSKAADDRADSAPATASITLPSVANGGTRG